MLGSLEVAAELAILDTFAAAVTAGSSAAVHGPVWSGATVWGVPHRQR